MTNAVTSLLVINLVLIVYAVWLQQKASRLTRENADKARALLQKNLQIDALERREMIEINNRRDGGDLDERLRSKGYLQPKF